MEIGDRNQGHTLVTTGGVAKAVHTTSGRPSFSITCRHAHFLLTGSADIPVPVNKNWSHVGCSGQQGQGGLQEGSDSDLDRSTSESEQGARERARLLVVVH